MFFRRCLIIGILLFSYHAQSGTSVKVHWKAPPSVSCPISRFFERTFGFPAARECQENVDSKASAHLPDDPEAFSWDSQDVLVVLKQLRLNSKDYRTTPPWKTNSCPKGSVESARFQKIENPSPSDAQLVIACTKNGKIFGNYHQLTVSRSFDKFKVTQFLSGTIDSEGEVSEMEQFNIGLGDSPAITRTKHVLNNNGSVQITHYTRPACWLSNLVGAGENCDPDKELISNVDRSAWCPPGVIKNVQEIPTERSETRNLAKCKTTPHKNFEPAFFRTDADGLKKTIVFQSDIYKSDGTLKPASLLRTKVQANADYENFSEGMRNCSDRRTSPLSPIQVNRFSGRDGKCLIHIKTKDRKDLQYFFTSDGGVHLMDHTNPNEVKIHSYYLLPSNNDLSVNSKILEAGKYLKIRHGKFLWEFDKQSGQLIGAYDEDGTLCVSGTSAGLQLADTCPGNWLFDLGVGIEENSAVLQRGRLAELNNGEGVRCKVPIGRIFQYKIGASSTIAEEALSPISGNKIVKYDIKSKPHLTQAIRSQASCKSMALPPASHSESPTAQ